jgi:hypothetical protein
MRARSAAESRVRIFAVMESPAATRAQPVNHARKRWKGIQCGMREAIQAGAWKCRVPKTTEADGEGVRGVQKASA